MNAIATSDCTIKFYAKDGRDGGDFLSIDFSELPLKKLVTLGSHGRKPSPAGGAWVLASYELRRYLKDRLPADNVVDIEISTTELTMTVRCRHGLSKPVQDLVVESLNNFGVTVDVM